MRNPVLILVGIGLAVVTLSGCASATSGGAGPTSNGPGASSAPSGGSSSASSASGLTGKIDMCTAFSAASLSSVTGKNFSTTLEEDSDGIYSCLYNLASDAGDWIVAVQEPFDGDVPTADGLDLGGPSAVKPVSGTGYTTVGSPAGVELQVGKDTVEVYTPATAPEAQATTAQFVAVAKAVIAAVK